MNRKVIYLGLSLGGIAGGYIPTIFGVGALSGWSLLGSTIGAIVGIFLAVRISQ